VFFGHATRFASTSWLWGCCLNLTNAMIKAINGMPDCFKSWYLGLPEQEMARSYHLLDYG